MDTLHEILSQYPGAVYDERHGEVHVNCPNCGKIVKRGQTHCSINVETGYGYCFVCGVGFSIRKPSEKREYVEPTPKIMRSEKHEWLKHPMRYLRDAFNHPDKYEIWQEYEPALTKETIDKYLLGVGSPYGEETFLFPVFENGVCVEIRPRFNKGKKSKFGKVSGSGSHLFKSANFCRNAIFIITENNVESMLVEQWSTNTEHNPPVVGVSPTAGAGNWRDEWTEFMLLTKPYAIGIIYDDNEAGILGTEKIVKSFSQFSQYVKVFEWPSYLPEKYDARDMLRDEIFGKRKLFSKFIKHIKGK